jgi:hypothetical protein
MNCEKESWWREFVASISAVPVGGVMKKLPIIRHVRWAWHLWRIERHYKAYASIGMLPVNRPFDDAVLLQIWRGKI